LPDDTLLYALPVCGPYVALKNFKFKVKLLPGTAKKGKSCKQAIDIFVRSDSKSYSILDVVMMILFQSQGLHFPREDVTEEFNGS
jgi:hypothetical protein